MGLGSCRCRRRASQWYGQVNFISHTIRVSLLRFIIRIVDIIITIRGTIIIDLIAILILVGRLHEGR